MSIKETAKRYILFLVSLFFSGVGVAFTKKGELGVSPISSVANILSIKFDFFTIGEWLIIFNCLLIIGQILILRKNFKPIQLLQVPLSFLFGYFTDLGLWMLSFFEAEIYAVRLMLVILGVIILGFGIALSVNANVIMNAGEAFVKAIADTLEKSFGNVKIAFDVCCVCAAVIMSLLFFGFEIRGTREGTFIAAVCTGLTVKFFTRVLRKPVEKLLG